MIYNAFGNSQSSSAITAFCSSFAWLDRRVWKLTVREFVSAAGYFILIFVFIGHFGILSIGIASVIDSALQGVLFLPPLVKRYKRVAADDVLASGPGQSQVAET